MLGNETSSPACFPGTGLCVHTPEHRVYSTQSLSACPKVQQIEGSVMHKCILLLAQGFKVGLSPFALSHSPFYASPSSSLPASLLTLLPPSLTHPCLSPRLWRIYCLQPPSTEAKRRQRHITWEQQSELMVELMVHSTDHHSTELKEKGGNGFIKPGNSRQERGLARRWARAATSM